MNMRRTFTIAASLLVSLCLACQIAICLLLRTKEGCADPPKMAITAPPVTTSAGAAALSPEQVQRELKRQDAKLRKLESQEEFFEFSAKELDLATLFKTGGGYFDCITTVDIHSPGFLQKVEKYREKRQGYMDKAQQMIEEFMAGEDFSFLTDEEYSVLTDFLENRRHWAQIAYDDYTGNEEKLEAFRKCYEDNICWKVRELIGKQFDGAYGDAFRKYEIEYDNSGLEEIIVRTNPWWINRAMTDFRDGSGERYRIRLFDDQ